MGAAILTFSNQLLCIQIDVRIKSKTTCTTIKMNERHMQTKLNEGIN